MGMSDLSSSDSPNSSTSFAIPYGTSDYVLRTDSVQKLDYVGIRAKIAIFILSWLLINLVLILLFGYFVIGGFVPSLIVYAVIETPIVRRLSSKRKKNEKSSPKIKTIPYSEIIESRINGRGVFLKSKNLQFRFKLQNENQQEVTSFLRQKLGSTLDDGTQIRRI